MVLDKKLERLENGMFQDPSCLGVLWLTVSISSHPVVKIQEYKRYMYVYNALLIYRFTSIHQIPFGNAFDI